MPASLSIHVPDSAVRLIDLPDRDPGGELVLGREPRCDVVIAHHSVSRRHLRLSQLAERRWQIEDLGSKNGTRVDGKALTAPRDINCGSWFAVGDIYCQLVFQELADQQQGAALLERRRHSSMAWNSRLSHGVEAQRLIADLLQGIVEVAEARRGFLLSVDHQGHWRVRACYGIAPDQLTEASFNGSRSAVERVIAEQRPVYMSDRHDLAWLRDRASVISGGIQALAALPLLRDGRVLGVAYADTDEQQRSYTELDAQLLEALVDHAGKVISALELEAQLAEVSALLEVGPGELRASVRPAPSWRVSSAALGSP
ncbi:MAG: FHA domain-containing protein [Xanthomonadales bacterium]|nr:FHA domain-containing protein [Xanthomonadales bacterium]